MDLTETYIKMRFAAIPDLGVGAEPMFFGGTEGIWVTNSVLIDHKGDFYGHTEDYGDISQCQLERQNQLQEMCEVSVMKDPRCLVGVFNHWLKGTRPVCESMEQLWLAFVMKEKGKVWNGEKWEDAVK